MDTKQKPDEGKWEPEIMFPGELPAYDEAGVDLTLIRWMLSLTPAERLRAAEEAAESILRLRNARRVG